MHVGKKDTKGIDCHSTAEHLFLLDFFPVSFLYKYYWDDNTDAEDFLPAMSPINLRGIESSSPTKFQHVYLRVPCISPASAPGLLSTSYSLLNEAPLGTLSKREWHLLIEWWFVISQFSLSNLSTMCVCGRCIDMARTSTETCSSRRWRCDDVFMCACSLVRLGCRV